MPGDPIVHEVVRFALETDENLFVGIDPGVTGAIGMVCGKKAGAVDIPTFTAVRSGKTKKGNDKTKTEFDLPSIAELFDVLGKVPNRAVALERQLIMPGERAYTAFRVGYGYGIWPLFLAALGFQVEEVMPSKWKKEMGLGKDKGMSRKKAMSLFPKVPLGLVKDHNRAEALLLAEWLRRTSSGRVLRG
jgi:crossover junction endodeoxyribonuclease RuvC